MAASGLSCGMRDPGCPVGSFIVVHGFSSCGVRTQQLRCMDSTLWSEDLEVVVHGLSSYGVRAQ